MNERDFGFQIEELFRICHWDYYHTWNSMHSPPGFPDYFAVRPPRLKLVELKLDGGELAVAQQGWREVLIRVPFLEYGLWTPSMWDEIVEDLR